MMMAPNSNLDFAIREYVSDIKDILGQDCERVVLYGSYARGEYGQDSDIDIAIFTSKEPKEFYLLFGKIAEATFEYSVKYDMILSPMFENTKDYSRMLGVLPYYQNIEREGISVG